MRLRLALLLLAGLGCGTSTEVEPQLTITQGLYGQLTERCDAEGCVGAPREGAPVAWFERSPFGPDAGVPAQERTSGKNGFYEFALDSGARGYLAIGKPSATAGVVWFTATSVAIPRGLGRVDWRASADNAGAWTDVR